MRFETGELRCSARPNRGGLAGGSGQRDQREHTAGLRSWNARLATFAKTNRVDRLRRFLLEEIRHHEMGADCA